MKRILKELIIILGWITTTICIFTDNIQGATLSILLMVYEKLGD